MLETKQEAKDGRESVKKDINEFTGEQVRLLREDFKKLKTSVDTAATDIGKAVTAQQLIDALEPIKTQLDNILRQKLTPAIPSSNGDTHPPTAIE